MGGENGLNWNWLVICGSILLATMFCFAIAMYYLVGLVAIGAPRTGFFAFLLFACAGVALTVLFQVVNARVAGEKK